MIGFMLFLALFGLLVLWLGWPSRFRGKEEAS
jgi:hypothetical protein